MEILVLVKMMEFDNLYYIYFFYVDDRWCVFGCFVYYLSIMYFELDDFVEVFFMSDGDCLFFFFVIEFCLLNFLDYYNILVLDIYIQVSVLFMVYSY